MAELGRCLSNRVAREREIGPSSEKTCGTRGTGSPWHWDGPRPTCIFERSWHGLGEGLGQPSPLPSHVLARVPTEQECPSPPAWRAPAGSEGTFPSPCPAALRPGTPQDPGSHPSTVCVPCCQRHRTEIRGGFLGQPVADSAQEPRWGRGQPRAGPASTGGHRAPGTAPQGARGCVLPGVWDGCRHCGGWGARCADAGCYDHSICWLLVCLLFNFFLIQSYIAVGGAGIIATLPECS